jgi:hypothetical protein
MIFVHRTACSREKQGGGTGNRVAPEFLLERGTDFLAFYGQTLSDRPRPTRIKSF